MPNILAYLVVFGYPVVVVVLFRKLPVPAALTWSLLLGYLFLPTGVGVDVPILPALDKVLIPSLSAAIMCFFVTRKARKPAPGRDPAARRRKTSLGTKVFRLLVAILIVTPFLTVSQNAEPIIVGLIYIPGMRLYDAFSIINASLVTILPLLLGRHFLNTPESHMTLLRAICLAGLAYSLLMMFEVRMSPQLNRWIYGFFPHSFEQHIRAGGFRPLVFLKHGLWVGIFTAMAILSAVTLWLHDRAVGKRSPWFLAGVWLLVTLFFAKTVGALILAVLMLLLLFFTRVRGQMIFAVCVASVVLLYPVLRTAGYIPVEEIYEFSKARSEDRAQSFKFRLDNEDILLERASEKPVSGWGGWGRSRVYDAENSEEVTTADGAWIIIIGQSGWLGYIAQFGLLTLPLLLLGLGSRRKLGLSLATSGLMVVLSINLIDLLPNGTLTPITFLLAGALLGRYEHARAALWGQKIAAAEQQVKAKIKARQPADPSPAFAATPAAPPSGPARHQRRSRSQPLTEE
ncbi:MAG: O-antigen ligase family protein [Sulfitobacter sp.]